MFVNRCVLRLLVLPLTAVLSAFVLPAGASADGHGDAAIEARWVALGSAAGVLGAKLPPPADAPYDVPGGRAMDFVGGSIFWSEATGAWDVRGTTLEAFLAAGGPAGTLGFPAAAAEPVGTTGAQFQVLTGGHIYSSTTTGAHAVQGAVLAKYLTAGGPGSRLGLPTTEETAVPGGTRTVFEGGQIYRSSTAAVVVVGAILKKYLALGTSAGFLGMPTSDETSAAGGSRFSVFTGGRIYWSSATGAQDVHGAILKRYLAIGETRSYLGLPTTGEYAVSGGRKNRFTGGHIVYRSGQGTVVTGTWRPSVQRVTAAQIPYTYRPGCPLGPAGLRRVMVPYYDWAGVPRHGELITRTSAADDLQRVFKRAFTARFPIRQMRPVDVWKGSDIAAMAADNTSAFNCRKVTGNPYRLSQHSYGNAIDINTVENPYVTSSRVYPTAGRAYLNRSKVRKGMIVGSGPIARGMRAEGWPWGARWARPDYQHFSANGG